MSNILPLPQPTLRLSAWGVLRETRSRSGKSQAVANRTMTSSHSPSDNEVSKSSHGRLHGTLLGVAIEGPGPCPLYWLVYRHNNQISVVIEPGACLIHARLRASLDQLDQGIDRCQNRRSPQRETRRDTSPLTPALPAFVGLSQAQAVTVFDHSRAHPLLHSLSCFCNSTGTALAPSCRWSRNRGALTNGHRRRMPARSARIRATCWTDEAPECPGSAYRPCSRLDGCCAARAPQ